MGNHAANREVRLCPCLPKQIPNLVLSPYPSWSHTCALVKRTALILARLCVPPLMLTLVILHSCGPFLGVSSAMRLLQHQTWLVIVSKASVACRILCIEHVCLCVYVFGCVSLIFVVLSCDVVKFIVYFCLLCLHSCQP